MMMAPPTPRRHRLAVTIAPANLDRALGRFRVIFLRAFCLSLLVCAVGASTAFADDWFPHPAGAKWTYFWSDSN
jgi:hypothetical protein